MDMQKLGKITTGIIDTVIQNYDIMFNDSIRAAATPDYKCVDLIEVIVYLHNCLWECVYNERYDYMFHWANKIGSYVQDAATIQDCVFRSK